MLRFQQNKQIIQLMENYRLEEHPGAIIRRKPMW